MINGEIRIKIELANGVLDWAKAILTDGCEEVRASSKFHTIHIRQGELGTAIHVCHDGGERIMPDLYIGGFNGHSWRDTAVIVEASIYHIESIPMTCPNGCCYKFGFIGTAEDGSPAVSVGGWNCGGYRYYAPHICNKSDSILWPDGDITPIPEKDVSSSLTHIRSSRIIDSSWEPA